MITEVLYLAVTTITDIWDSFRNTQLDGISLLLIFLTILLFEVIIEFIFDMIGMVKYDAEPKPNRPNGGK